MPPAKDVEVGVGAVVIFNGELLMVRRAGASGAGSWAIPGGWVEYGEQAEDTVIREVKEETGLDVMITERLGWICVEDDELKRWIAILFLGCQQIDMWQTPSVTEPEKCPEVEYVPLNEVWGRRIFLGTAEAIRQFPEWFSE